MHVISQVDQRKKGRLQAPKAPQPPFSSREWPFGPMVLAFSLGLACTALAHVFRRRN